jgi:pyruvate/2-oxoglutarate/acetoin dehydrogenase E1 component
MSFADFALSASDDLFNEVAKIRYMFDELDGPIERVPAKHAPMPFSPSLENMILPNVDDIRAAIRTALQ